MTSLPEDEKIRGYGEWDIEVDGVKYAGRRTLTTIRHEEAQKREEAVREVVEKLREYQKGWLGTEEDGSDRAPEYDVIEDAIKALQDNK